LYDGLVLARSVFESSMHYRSAMVLGRAHPVDGDAKMYALEAITEHLMPGRWDEARHPNRKELAATLVLELPLVEWSVKVSNSPPDDLAEDLSRDVWAGVLPVRETYREPRPAPDLRPETPVPAYVATWR
jgi:nitroimidazol reductase NimA-like FMN-containing flavoprotein (pyridoxamine 5'-phosphate oxidase superfamily)